jgi:hypothetical protein
MVLVEDVKASREELVRRLCAAELAVARCVWVGEVSPGGGNVPIHVLRAGESRGGVQAHELDRRALDLLAADDCNVT